MVPLFIMNKSVLMTASILNIVVISCYKAYTLDFQNVYGENNVI